MKCPKCGGEAEHDQVDNGIGMQQCGPWNCPACQWVEASDPFGFAMVAEADALRAENLRLYAEAKRWQPVIDAAIALQDCDSGDDHPDPCDGDCAACEHEDALYHALVDARAGGEDGAK